MNRYLIFAYDLKYPCGAKRDFKGACETIKEVVKRIKQLKEEDKLYEYYDFLDTSTGLWFYKDDLERLHKEEIQNIKTNKEMKTGGKEFNDDQIFKEVKQLIIEGKTIGDISVILDIPYQNIYHLLKKFKTSASAIREEKMFVKVEELPKEDYMIRFSSEEPQATDLIKIKKQEENTKVETQNPGFNYYKEYFMNALQHDVCSAIDLETIKVKYNINIDSKRIAGLLTNEFIKEIENQNK